MYCTHLILLAGNCKYVDLIFGGPAKSPFTEVKKRQINPQSPPPKMLLVVAFLQTTNMMTDWFYSMIQALGALWWGVTTLGTRFSCFDRNDGRERPFRRHRGRPQTQLRPAGKHDEDQRLRLQPGPRSPGRDEVVPHHGLSGQQAWSGNSGDQPHGEKMSHVGFSHWKQCIFQLLSWRSPVRHHGLKGTGFLFGQLIISQELTVAVRLTFQP